MDRPLAAQLCAACKYIYRSNLDDVSGLGVPRSAIQSHSDDNRIQTSTAGILRYPDKTVVVFQGTLTGRNAASVRDWLANFDAYSENVDGFAGRVHRGFAGQLKGVAQLLIDDLTARKFAAPLYVTGHSQGGAVAVLATQALQAAGFPVTATYTFAAPRAGNDAFADSVKTPVFRLEFGNDIVPHVPIRLSTMGKIQQAAQFVPRLAPILDRITVDDKLAYRAAGTLVYAAPWRKTLTIGPTPDEDRKLEEARRLRLVLAKDQLFNHHHLKNYEAMLAS